MEQVTNEQADPSHRQSRGPQVAWSPSPSSIIKYGSMRFISILVHRRYQKPRIFFILIRRKFDPPLKKNVVRCQNVDGRSLMECDDCSNARSINRCSPRRSQSNFCVAAKFSVASVADSQSNCDRASIQFQPDNDEDTRLDTKLQLDAEMCVFLFFFTPADFHPIRSRGVQCGTFGARRVSDCVRRSQRHGFYR